MKLNDLPKSDDEAWDGAEKQINTPVKMPICETHGREIWMDHKGYKDNHDGTISCSMCGWGTILPGYMKVYNGRVFDLRQG